MRHTFIISLVIFICIPFAAVAQIIKSDTGTYTYVVSKQETLEQAEHSAIKQAKLQIIANNFGTTISATTTLTIDNRNGISSSESRTFGETDVRGEWIETVGEPKIIRKVINNEFVIEVTISGRIREIKSSKVDIKAKVLKEGIEDRFESESFTQGDKMYMSFQTPVDGYLAIYMTDGKIVQCLFPYRGMPSDKMEVKADQRYIFFSKSHTNGLDPALVRTCTLGCERDNEPARIYLIFSPNKFSKAVDNPDKNVRVPNTLDFDEFQQWLSRLKRQDQEVNQQTYDIIINKR